MSFTPCNLKAKSPFMLWSFGANVSSIVATDDIHMTHRSHYLVQSSFVTIVHTELSRYMNKCLICFVHNGMGELVTGSSFYSI